MLDECLSPEVFIQNSIVVSVLDGISMRACQKELPDETGLS
jgi:hypothetical protein